MTSSILALILFLVSAVHGAKDCSAKPAVTGCIGLCEYKIADPSVPVHVSVKCIARANIKEEILLGIQIPDKTLCKDEEGCYLTLRAVKNIQYGNKSTITEIKILLVDVTVTNEVYMSQQIRSKGGSAFNAISDRLVLKSSSDLAFGKDAANMLKAKELKSKQQEIAEIEADWSRAQKDIMKSKLLLTDAEADKLAREQSKNKLLAQCIENGKKHKYAAPLSSQADMKKCFDRIKKLSEKDQLSVLKFVLFGLCQILWYS